ncbi:KH domain-containing protein [Desulfobulbus alkaliphilus]|uniref:KH domain-containing protein n=1 Tax=Desulfobulbus alkaliphilus TaxID=869814 RepID=UPI0019659FAA|nr:KH domain-containing protein [Desulfobulbus alkaliphilus]MBM9536413.1 KH domain-containing protein [Desulfobulbus alkaliphilus]
MKELIEFIASRLVDHPEKIAVTLQEDEESVIIELRVAQEDLGKVIGKQGRTARAMRAVLAASRTGDTKRARLEIVE